MVTRQRESHFRDIAFTIGTRIGGRCNSLVKQGKNPLRWRRDRLTLIPENNDELGSSLLDLKQKDAFLNPLAQAGARICRKKVGDKAGAFTVTAAHLKPCANSGGKDCDSRIIRGCAG
jgi:hypothetical protein